MGSIARFVARASVAWCFFTSGAHAEGPAAEAGPSRAECVGAHEQAQDQRLAGQLLAARASLRGCSAAACPGLISRDCVAWLAEIERQIPSVIFRATKDGEDVVALKVREGERVLTDSITGTPLELEAGPHRFVAELPGFPQQDATYVLQAGDKARVVSFDFASPKPMPPAAQPPAPPKPVSKPLAAPRPIPTLTYASGGATLGLAVTGGVLGGLALAKRKDVQGDCAPLCSTRDVRGIKQLAFGADVAFALALIGAGVTVYSYVLRPEVPATTGVVSGQTARWQLVWLGLGLAAGGSF